MLHALARACTIALCSCARILVCAPALARLHSSHCAPVRLQSQSPRALAPLCPATTALSHARAVAHPCARLPLHAQAAHSWAARLRTRAIARSRPHAPALPRTRALVPAVPVPSHPHPPTPHLAHVRFGARRLLHAGACPPAVTWLAGRSLAPRYPVAVVTAWGRCAHARWVGRRFPPSLSSPPAPSTHPGSPRVSLRSLRLARYLQVYLRFSLALWACPSSPELPEAFLPPGSPQVSSPPACPSSPSDLSQVSPFPFILPKLFSSLIFPLPQPFVASLALLPHAKL